jgi:hypothetical protein
VRPNPFVQPLIHFVPCSVTYSAALVLKRQCDRTPGGRRQKQNDLSSCPGCPGQLSGLSVSHSKSVLYGTFVWARRVLNNQKRRVPARADVKRSSTSSVDARPARPAGTRGGRCAGRGGRGGGGSAFVASGSRLAFAGIPFPVIRQSEA